MKDDVAWFLGALIGLLVGISVGWKTDITSVDIEYATIVCSKNDGIESVDGYSIRCRSGANFDYLEGCEFWDGPNVAGSCLNNFKKFKESQQPTEVITNGYGNRPRGKTFEVRF